MAVFAVAAVILLAGGNPAQATTAETVTPDSGGDIDLRPVHQVPGKTATPTPTPTPEPHATPEPCPGEEGNSNTEAADVVSSGHIALFDVYWNAEDEEELTLNPCPPYVKRMGSADIRSPSDINIEKTVIHVPNSARINLNTSEKYTEAKYPELWAADNEEDRNRSGMGDRLVWELPACPPDGSSDSVMCLMFSAALLNPKDWGDLDNTVKGDGKVEFHIDHVHQLDTGGQGRRYVLAYDVPSPSTSVPYAAIINSSNANHGGVEVTPGEYERPDLLFTRTGKYEFQMHVTGHPEREPAGNRSAVSPDPAVSSDVREYLFHVGLMADLSVDLTAVPESASPGDDVTITITASNAGPDTATNTKVHVEMPDGLTYSTDPTKQPDPSTGTYDTATGVWDIGDLAVTNDDNAPITTDDSPTLTITATVDAGTRGETLKAKATISAKELADSVDAFELDPDTDDNMSMDTIDVVSIPNVDPIVSVRCFVNEFSKPGTKVCDPVKVKDPDNANNTLTYDLIGDGREHFVAKHVEGGAQIEVAPGANIEYATRQSYTLNLTVSDGKDEHGNDDSDLDSAVDETVHVTIDVRDFIVNLTASKTNPVVGEEVTFTVTLKNSPVPVDELTYYWGTRDPGDTSVPFEGYGGVGNPGTITVLPTKAVSLVYRIQFSYYVDNVEYGLTNSDEITVTWANQ